MIAVVLAGCAEPDVARPGAGDALPRFELERLHGGRVSSERYEGRPLLLNLWATWCGPCREEMPSLQRLAERAAPKLQVVGVSVDQDANLAREFVLRAGLGFENLLDRGGSWASQSLGVRAFPSTYLVGPDGRIVAVVVGSRDWSGDSGRRELERFPGITYGPPSH